MGRKVDHARGKVLGGSSSINGMIYQRGNPMDYEGCNQKVWNHAHCLPYFKRLEKHTVLHHLINSEDITVQLN